MYDLAIIGGGPAGAAAAITAGRAGARVLLIERGRFPRHKVCGEFVSAESLALLRGLLDSAESPLFQDVPSIARARIFVDDRVIATEVAPAAASIARYDLDSALWEAAIGAQVEARESLAVQRIEGDGPFRITSTGGNFEARVVINSTGRWSNLGAALAPPGKAGAKWLGLKAHFTEVNPPASVDLYFFEGGYCGVQPVRLRQSESAEGRVNACAMVRSEIGGTLAEVFAQHPELARRSRAWRQLSEPVSTSPLIFREPEPTRGNMLLAGDAAGFVDPFVGDGISLALRSGALAAACLGAFFRGEASLDLCANRYRELYTRQLGPVFRNSAKIRHALALPRVLRVPMVSLLQRFPAAASFMVRKTR